jgi:Putative DNA-binding domain
VTSASVNPSSQLRAFQDGFAAALMAPAGPAGGASDIPPEIARLVAQPGFAVYRNTVQKGCIDALQANFPAVSRLVGDEWFRAAAGVYARAHLPRQPSLLDYGTDFADFLATFEPAAQLPYLAGVARLDRFWIEAHVARNEIPVAAAAVAQFAAGELARVVLHPHAAARWAWFDDAPIFSIWGRNRTADSVVSDAASLAPALAWAAEGMLITRPRGAVLWTPLEKPGCAFLDACAAGGTLAAAATAALDADPQADLAALLAHMLDAGAFGRLTLHDDDRGEPEP